MCGLKIFLIAILLLGIDGKPDYSGSVNKLVKVNEHEKSKNVLMVKKTKVEQTGDESEESGSRSKEDSKEKGRSAVADNENEPQPQHIPPPLGVGDHHDHGQSVDGSCVTPPPQPLELYEEFARTMVTHRMFVLASSKHYADQAALVLTGEGLDIDEIPRACLRVVVDQNERRLAGYNGSSILSCKTEHVFDITCFREEDPENTLQITYVWTNGRSSVLAIMCANGQGSWAVMANKREVSDETLGAVVDIVEGFGFNRDDVVEYSWAEDDCPSAVSNRYTEGPCAQESLVGTIHDDKVDKAKAILSLGVYTPLSSYANVFATAAFIRGKPLHPNDDLNEVCSKDQWSANGEVSRVGFHNQDAFLECNMTDFQSISCYPDDDKADAGASGIIYNEQIYPIWTDSKKYVLTYNCLSSNLRTWSLLSTSKHPVKPKLKNYILAKVADYGFDPQLAFEADYSKCTKSN